MAAISDGPLLEVLLFLTRKELSLCIELVSLKWHRLASTSPYLRPRHLISKFSLNNNDALCHSHAVVGEKDGEDTVDWPEHSLSALPDTTAVPHYLRFVDVQLDNVPLSEQNLQWLHALKHTFESSKISLAIHGTMGVECEETVQKVAIAAMGSTLYVHSPNYTEDTPLTAHGLSVQTIA